MVWNQLIFVIPLSLVFLSPHEPNKQEDTDNQLLALIIRKFLTDSWAQE